MAFMLRMLGLFFVFVIAAVAYRNDDKSTKSPTIETGTIYKKVAPTPEPIIKSVSTARDGIVLILTSVTIHNPAKVELRDFSLNCDVMGPSGTKIHTIKQTLYEAIGPEKTRTFSKVNMGLLHSQGSNVSCAASRW